MQQGLARYWVVKMKGWKNRVHVHLKWDLIFIAGFILLSIPNALSYSAFFTHFGDKTEWYEYYLPPIKEIAAGDPFIISMYIIMFFLAILIFNAGFRTFEWNDKSFCMKSMFQERCYRWDQVEEVIFDYRLSTGKLINILTTDGGFYYGPLHVQVEKLFREKMPEKCRTADYEDHMSELSYWRSRRKNSGVKMMFFQP